jgi:hypothetical protein
MIILLKGGPSSGWFAPPKGTHSGKKHRAAGSGKSGKTGMVGGSSGGTAEQKAAADISRESSAEALALHTVGKASEVRSGPFGKGYFITGYDIFTGKSDGDLVDVTSDFGAETNDHVGFLIATEYPKALGMQKSEISAFRKINERLYGSNGVYSSSPSPKNAGLSRRQIDRLDDTWLERYDKLWSRIYANGNVRVREFGLRPGQGKHTISVDRMMKNKRSVEALQLWVLTGKIASDKNASYSVGWFDGDWVDFTWDELMAAKHPRDLKDELPVITVRFKGCICYG